MFPRDPQWNIEVEGKPNSLFLEGPVIKSFVIPPDSKIEKILQKNDLLEAVVYTARARKIERPPKLTFPIEKSR